MSVVRIAVPKPPKRIRVTDSDALLEHAKVLQLRSRLHDLIDQSMRPAEQQVEEAKLRLRQAEVAAEQVKLEVDTIALQERKAVESFYTVVRRATPQVRSFAERYGADVAFSFDSNGRSVWVMALFGKGAPPVTASFLRDGPPGLLRMSGRGDGIPLDDEQEEDGGDEDQD
jgi:hypothetical protein